MYQLAKFALLDRRRPPGYQGPGDVVSGALGWWGLRAYSNATKGTNAIRIRRESDNSEQNFVTLSNGSLDKVSITSFLTSTTGRVVTLYDQTGNTRDQTQATAANQPLINLSGLGSFVTIDFDRALSERLASPSVSQAAPYTYSSAAKYINNGIAAEVLSTTGDTAYFGFRVSANNQIYMGIQGVNLTITAADGTWHRMQARFHASNRRLLVDGGAATDGVSTLDLGTPVQFGGRSGLYMNGSAVEAGVWPSSLSDSQMSALDSNQSAYWGI